MVDAAAVILWFAVTAYAVFGGAAFGAGFWALLCPPGEKGERPRSLIRHAVGPVWEASHVWLAPGAARAVDRLPGGVRLGPVDDGGPAGRWRRSPSCCGWRPTSSAWRGVVPGRGQGLEPGVVGDVGRRAVPARRGAGRRGVGPGGGGRRRRRLGGGVDEPDVGGRRPGGGGPRRLRGSHPPGVGGVPVRRRAARALLRHRAVLAAAAAGALGVVGVFVLGGGRAVRPARADPRGTAAGAWRRSCSAWPPWRPCAGAPAGAPAS